MASTDGKSLDGLDADDTLDSPSNDSVPPYSAMPMHMYPFPPGLMPTQSLRTKRRQVRNACTNCQKACKKCDDARPCLRCVKYGIAEECIDSQRKERKKGIKRGPYKKRDGKGNNVDQIDEPAQQGLPTTTTGSVATNSGSLPMGPYVGSTAGYPLGYYPQYSPLPGPKPGEGPAYYPQFYIPVPAHPPQPQTHGGLEPENSGYSSHHPPFYPATFLTPFAQPFPPYIMHTRAEGQVAVPNAHYPSYAGPMYHKTNTGSSGNVGTGAKHLRLDHSHGADNQDEKSG